MRREQSRTFMINNKKFSCVIVTTNPLTNFNSIKIEDILLNKHRANLARITQVRKLKNEEIDCEEVVVDREDIKSAWGISRLVVAAIFMEHSYSYISYMLNVTKYEVSRLDDKSVLSNFNNGRLKKDFISIVKFIEKCFDF